MCPVTQASLHEHHSNLGRRDKSCAPLCRLVAGFPSVAFHVRVAHRGDEAVVQLKAVGMARFASDGQRSHGVTAIDWKLRRYKKIRTPP